MERKCIECMVVFDMADDEKHEKFHESRKKIIELYTTYRDNQFKWRTDLHVHRDHNANRWKSELLALSSDAGIALDVYVFLEVLFRPFEYYQNRVLDPFFINSFYDHTSIHYHAKGLSKTNILIQLKLEMMNINNMNDKYIANVALYEFKMDSSDRIVEVHSIFTFVEHYYTHCVPNDIQVNYKHFIEKCLIIFRTYWKLPIFMIRYLINFLLTDKLGAIYVYI